MHLGSMQYLARYKGLIGSNGWRFHFNNLLMNKRDINIEKKNLENVKTRHANLKLHLKKRLESVTPKILSNDFLPIRAQVKNSSSWITVKTT